MRNYLTSQDSIIIWGEVSEWEEWERNKQKKIDDLDDASGSDVDNAKKIKWRIIACGRISKTKRKRRKNLLVEKKEEKTVVELSVEIYEFMCHMKYN